jgi:hypothetical protein
LVCQSVITKIINPLMLDNVFIIPPTMEVAYEYQKE